MFYYDYFKGKHEFDGIHLDSTELGGYHNFHQTLHFGGEKR